MLKPIIFKIFSHLLSILLFIGLMYFLIPLLEEMVISNDLKSQYRSSFLQDGFLFIELVAGLVAGFLAYFFAGLLAGLSAGLLLLSWRYGMTLILGFPLREEFVGILFLIFIALNFFIFLFSIYHLRKKKGKWKVKYPFLIWYCLIFINAFVPSCAIYILVMNL